MLLFLRSRVNIFHSLRLHFSLSIYFNVNDLRYLRVFNRRRDNLFSFLLFRNSFLLANKLDWHFKVSFKTGFGDPVRDLPQQKDHYSLGLPTFFSSALHYRMECQKKCVPFMYLIYIRSCYCYLLKMLQEISLDNSFAKHWWLEWEIIMRILHKCNVLIYIFSK
jgi:hypothetical protein